MLHRKSRIKNHLRSAEKRLTARRELLNACRELLTANGVNVDIIEKNNYIKHIKTKVRKAERELASIAVMETLMAEIAEARLQLRNGRQTGSTAWQIEEEG